MDLFATSLLRPIAAAGRRRDRMRTVNEIESMLATARLRPLSWHPIFALGPVTIVRAVVAQAT